MRSILDTVGLASVKSAKRIEQKMSVLDLVSSIIQFKVTTLIKFNLDILMRRFI